MKPWLVALALCLGAVAIAALPPAIQPGDAGEFATVMLRGGIPHPSGYPWMRMLGVVARGLEAIGVGPAAATALPCAAAGLVGWILIASVAARFAAAAGAAAPAVAAFVVLIVAGSSVVVTHSVDCEVWGPLVLLAGVCLSTAFADRPKPLRVGLAFGIAVSHHLTAVLMLPVCAAAVWPSVHRDARWQERLQRLGAVVLRAGVGTAAGLMSYATLLVGGAGAWRWGETDTLSGFARHLVRADYGAFQLSLHETTPEPAHQLARVASSLGGAVTTELVQGPLLAAALLVAALAASTRCRPPGVAARPYFGLLTSVALCAVAFPLASNIDPRGAPQAWILERFDILPLALMAPLLAATLAAVVAATHRRLVRVGLGAVAVALSIRQLVAVGPPERHGRQTVQRYATDVLATPDRGRALVFGTDDHRLFPILYTQQVLGLGVDVVYVDASLLAHAWYRARLRRRVPGFPDESKPLRLIGQLWTDPALRDTPVYLANLFSEPASQLNMVPEGLLMRVVRVGDPQPPLDDVLARHVAALDRYGPPPPIVGDPFARSVAARYADGSTRLARALAAAGRRREAQALLTRLGKPPQ